MYRCFQPDVMHAGYLGWWIFQHQFGARPSCCSKQPRRNIRINTYIFLVISVAVVFFSLLLILKRNIKIVLWRPFVYWWKNARTNEVNVASLFAACTDIPAFHFEFQRVLFGFIFQCFGIVRKHHLNNHAHAHSSFVYWIFCTLSIEFWTEIHQLNWAQLTNGSKKPA